MQLTFETLTYLTIVQYFLDKSSNFFTMVYMELNTLKAKDAFILNLKAAIEARGLTYQQLGEMAGVTKQQISNLLNGENSLTLNKTFEKIASALGIEETDLFDPEFKIKHLNKKD